MRQLYPPGPRSFVPGSALISFRLDPIKFLSTLACDYGDIAYFGAGSQHYFFINNPDYIKTVLVTNQESFKKGRGLEQAKRMLGNGLLTSEGEVHHRQRQVIDSHDGDCKTPGKPVSVPPPELRQKKTDRAVCTYRPVGSRLAA